MFVRLQKVRQGDRVCHVVIGGRLVVEDGVLLSADAAYVAATARTQADRLRTRMARV